MTFLIDAQLPPKTCEILENHGFQANHIEDLLDGDDTSDRDIIKYADKKGWMVMTKDKDFYYSHMILRSPRKLFLITTGNIKNRILFDLIRENIKTIEKLIASCDYIEMSNDGLYGV